jgi:hypothetical protein
VLDGLEVSEVGGESGVLKLLLNTTKYDQVKILSEVPPDLVYQLSIVNVVSSRFQSKLLKSVCREIYLHQDAKDRKRAGEAVEIGASMSRMNSEED